jgi:hypothetical protein
LRGFSKIKKIVRGLRYLGLDDLIDTKVIIQSPDSVENDVQAALRHSLPMIGRLRTENQTMHATLKKYGLLDLEFEVEQTAA